jgi:hypothetical protein
VVKLVGGDDPTRLKRLAVRFSKNVFPGNDVETVVYQVDDDGAYCFEAMSGGQDVVKNGWALISKR